MLLVLMRAVLTGCPSYWIRLAVILSAVGSWAGLSGVVAGVLALPFGIQNAYWQAFGYLWAAAAGVLGYWLFVPAEVIVRTAAAIKDLQDRTVAAIEAVAAKGTSPDAE